MKKIISTIIIFAIWLFIFPQIISAQVVINEFQISPSTSQWIELFNKGSDMDISGWIIDDSANGSSSKFTIPSGTTLFSGKCISFESGNFNWNTTSADSVRLLSGPSVIEEYPYLTSSGSNISVGREVDGEGNLIVLANQSRDKYNSSNLSCLVPTPTPTPSSSPGPTQTPSKAIYKINKPKNDSGAELTSVQIYVDGEYIHHEDEEILEFYSGHECYSGINCSFGIHSISLRKIGYSNWGETNDFQVGMSLEVNPILNKQTTASPVPTPTKTPTPVPTKSPTPKSSPTPNIKILGEATGSGNVENISDLRVSLNQVDSTSIPISGFSQNKFPFLPLIFVLAGIVLIGISGYLAFKKQKENSPDILIK